MFSLAESAFWSAFFVAFSSLKQPFSPLLPIAEPGSSPRNVQVRPLSSSTMVIQWDEPSAQNGQVTVSESSRCLFLLALYNVVNVHFSSSATDADAASQHSVLYDRRLLLASTFFFPLVYSLVDRFASAKKSPP